MGTIHVPNTELSTEAQEQLTRAYDLLAQAKPQEALPACQAVIDAAPEFAEAYNLKGILLEQLEKPRQALEAYQTAVHLAPDFADAQSNLSELKKEIEKARRWASKNSIGRDTSQSEFDVMKWDLPVEAQKQLDLAYDLQSQQKPEEALQACATMIEIAPESALAYNLKGILLEEMEKSQQAIEAYQTALQLAPDFANARLNLAELQDEIVEIQYREYRTPAWKVAAQGAFVCGVFFALVEGVSMFLLGYLGVLTTAIYMAGYGLSCGLGVYVIGASSKFKATPYLSLFAGVGCAVAYGVSRLVSFVYTRSSFYSTFDDIQILLRCAIIGLITGAALGIVQKTPRQLKLSIGAGLISFSLYALFSYLTTKAIFGWYLSFIPGKADDLVALSRAMVIPKAIEGGLMGVAVGAAFGWVVAQNPMKNLFIADEINDGED